MNQEEARKEAFILARGIRGDGGSGGISEFVGGKENPRELSNRFSIFTRHKLLEFFDKENLPYSVIHAAFHHYGGDLSGKLTCDDLEYAIAQAKTSLPEALNFRTRKGEIIGSVKWSDCINIDFTNLLTGLFRYHPVLLTEETEEMLEFMPKAIEKYLKSKADYDRHDWDRKKQFCILALMMHSAGIKGLPGEYTEKCINDLGYNIKLYKNGRYDWLSPPNNPVNDPHLSLVISIAPEIFGCLPEEYEYKRRYEHEKEKVRCENNLGAKEISNLLLADSPPWYVIDDELTVKERKAELRFNFGDGELLKDPIKARDILKVIALYVELRPTNLR